MRQNLLRLFIALTLFLSINLAATAQDGRSVFWRHWDVNITNLDMVRNVFDVAEIYDVQFSGTFRFGSAVIPNTRLESISNVEVLEDGRPLQRSCSGNPGTFCVENVQEGTSITYYFERSITDDNQQFEIRYTVSGALRSYEGGDQLWWIAVPEDKYGFSVGASTITVTLPDGYAPREGIDPIETYGVTSTVNQNGTRVTAVANTPIGPNEVFEIRVQFPHNPNARMPGWQANYDRTEELKPLINVSMLILGMLIGLGGPLGVFYTWYTRGRDPRTGLVPEYLSDLPSDLPPAVVGSLVDEKADLRDVLSTLIDLAQRGFIVIEENRTEGFFGLGGRSEFTFKLTDKSLAELRPFEHTFVKRLFGGMKERRLDSLRNKFYSYIPGLKNNLYDEMVKAGLFRTSPETTRTKWRGGGIIIMVGSLFAFFALIDTAAESFPTLMILPFAFGLTGLLMVIMGESMPAKTPKGAEEAAKWKAFRRYLVNLEKYTTLEEAAVNFDKFLPYAVAFGVDRAWIKKFSKLATMPTPTWYYPTWRGGYWSGGYRAGTPLPGGGLPSFRDGLPGDLARAGGSGGLNDLASGVSGGLDSISSGLTNMLNSAGSVMTSRPQSSSSGGRGFSGGGSFGGGSGGGSRGFG